MKTRKLISLAVMLVMLISLLPAQHAFADDPIKVDIASVYMDGSCIDDCALLLTEKLNESGLFNATYYNNSQLGNASDMFENVLGGDYMIAIGGGSDWGDAVSEPNMGVTMTPFLYDEYEDVHGITNSDFWNKMLESAAGKGVKLLNYPMISGARYFLTPTKVVEPSDFAGMKVRTPTSSYYVNAMTAFGANAVGIPPTELYTAISQKLVDGAEYPYADAYFRQLYEVLDYAATTPYVYTYDFFGTSTALWDALNDEQKQVLEDAAAAAADYSYTIYKEQDAEGKANLEAKGMTFVDIDVDAFRDCMDTFYDLCNWTDEFKADVASAMESYYASK